MRIVRAAAAYCVLAATTIVVLTSCDVGTTDPFPEYRGVNLFDAWGISDGADWSDDWTAEHGVTVADVSGSFNYIELTTPAGQTGPAGVAGSDASVRMVEIPNLYGNGDFEVGTVGDLPPGWSESNGADGNIVELETEPIIDGRTLAIDKPAADFARVSYNLRDTGFGILDKWIENASYGLRFDFNVADEVREFFVEYNDNVDGTNGTVHSLGQEMAIEIPVEDDPFLQRSFPGETGEENLLTVPNDASGHYFSIGTVKQGADRILGHMDNLRFYRADIQPRMSLEIPLSAATADLPFLRGKYRFSLWVKATPDGLVTPVVANAYRARLFGVMGETKPVLGSANRKYTNETADNGFVFSTEEWQQIFVDFFLETLPPADSDIVMTLGFSPDHLVVETVESGRDIGRVLVAAPELIFDPQN